MNLHHLELFYYVARYGGISRAVRHIPYGIQQPAVSGQILQLEQDLGAKLFDRQPFRLTAAGQELYAFARPFFDQAEGVAHRLRSRQAPTLRIAAAELILRSYLPVVIDRMRARHPGLRLGLRSGFQRDIETWLQEGLFDLGIIALESRPQPGLKCDRLIQLPPVLLVRHDSPVQTAAELWRRDVIDEPLICLPPTEAIAQTFRRALQQMKIEWPTTLEASSTEVVVQYVAAGYGIGVGLYVPDLVQHPQVRTIPLPGFDPVEVVLLWRPPATALVEELRDEVHRRARELWPDLTAPQVRA